MFVHWTDHLRSFWGWYDEEPEYRCAENDLLPLQNTISQGLRDAGYPDFALSIESVTSEASLNNEIISQYTKEFALYAEINRLLRSAHAGENLRGQPLVSWMLQFNCALRRRPIFEGVAYRGVDMPRKDMDIYQTGLMFVWASFVSASKSRNISIEYDTNVIFDIKPGGSYSMYGKRNPYDISEISDLPDEQEVVFPIACTYRVNSVGKEGRRTLISLETVDYY